MTPSERSTRYAPESVANAPMLRPDRHPEPGEAPVTFSARRLSGLGTPPTSLPWIYDPIGGEG